MTLPPIADRNANLRRRIEAWLWTGPLGHLLGGSLDILVALARHQLARARGRKDH